MWLLGATLEDRWHLPGLLFYIPALFCVALGLVWLLTTRRSPSGYLVFLVGIGVSAAFLKAICIDFAWNAPRPSREDSLRFVYWNAARGKLGIDRIAASLAADRPDICLLSESPKGEDLERVAEAVIESGHSERVSSLALISRFPIRSQERIPLEKGRLVFWQLELDRGPLGLLAVDLKSNPFVNRAVPLKQISDWLDLQNLDYPTIVAGDFNTPRDSVHFYGIRKNYSHPYENVGRGWPYTWPFPLPLWSVDHIWVSHEIAPVSYGLKPTSCSDHLKQVLDFTLPTIPRN